MISTDPAVCPFEVERPVMLQRWATLTFLHWGFDPADVQRLLPPALTVETCDDRAWVSLVPFFMHVRTERVGEVPWVSRFCETNVRTYVRDADGRSGIWFFSLDAERLGVVAVARTTYRLPYFWSAMALDRHGDTISYRTRRRWPGPRGASSEVTVDVGDPYAIEELTALDHFLTARWTLFSVRGQRFRFARAFHQRWPLQRAVARVFDDELLHAAGLPCPHGDPLVHFSEGVDVRIGRPEKSR